MQWAAKSMMEKVIVAKSRISNSTDICITRYGNVIYSRGSVIPLFIDLLKKQTLTVTNLNMTRFLMSMNDAIDLVYLHLKMEKMEKYLLENLLQLQLKL